MLSLAREEHRTSAAVIAARTVHTGERFVVLRQVAVDVAAEPLHSVQRGDLRVQRLVCKSGQSQLTRPAGLVVSDNHEAGEAKVGYSVRRHALVEGQQPGVGIPAADRVIPRIDESPAAEVQLRTHFGAGQPHRSLSRKPVREGQVAPDLDAARDEGITARISEHRALEFQILPDARVAEGNLSLGGKPGPRPHAEADGQIEGVNCPAPPASNAGPVQADDPADVSAGKPHLPVDGGFLTEQIIINHEAVSEQRHLAWVVEQRPLHLERAGNVRAGEHQLP